MRETLATVGALSQGHFVGTGLLVLSILFAVPRLLAAEFLFDNTISLQRGMERD